MEIRRYQDADAEEIAQVVAKTLTISNSKDYSKENIEATIASHSAEILRERVKGGHMYVVCDGSKIIGCGAIAPNWESVTESVILCVFILPEYQGKGIGRQLIETLEQDEYFLRANRIEIPSSITAVEFYKKLGYNHKNGVAELDEEQLYRLEKFR